MRKVYRESAGLEVRMPMVAKDEVNPVHRKTQVSRAHVRPWVSRDLRRSRKIVSDGQQGDIPVLEYMVMEGRSRLTKPDDWKCLAKSEV